MIKRFRVAHPSGGKMMTKQADKDGCNINLIMKRYARTGVLPVTDKDPIYGDFASGLDYHQAQNAIVSAQAEFDALPAAVRKHVDNDPGKFLDMVGDPDRVQELMDLGMLENFIPDKKIVLDPASPPSTGSEAKTTPAEA